MADPGKFADSKKYLVKGSTLNQMLAEIRANRPIPGEGLQARATADGVHFRLQQSPKRWGFEVYRSGVDKVSVVPSIVSGVGVLGEMPVIGATALDAIPIPQLTMASNAAGYIGLELEVVPETEEVGEDLWRIKADAGLLTGSIEVNYYATAGAMETAQQEPVINESTGAVVDNGIYVIPLAKGDGAGGINQVGCWGPIWVRMCDSGVLQVSSPIYAVTNA